MFGKQEKLKMAHSVKLTRVWARHKYGNMHVSNTMKSHWPISSMKMMQGWIFTANEKTAAVSFCDSPYHLSVSVDGCRLMNWQPEALAVALAIRVFPHPGGPNKSTPGRASQRVMEDIIWLESLLLKSGPPSAVQVTHKTGLVDQSCLAVGSVAHTRWLGTCRVHTWTLYYQILCPFS